MQEKVKQENQANWSSRRSMRRSSVLPGARSCLWAKRQARVRQELIQPVLALDGEGLKLGRGVGGVSEGLYHTPVAVQCQVELGPRLD